MAIYRVEHKKNYTTVNNFICKDSRLSWKAKGIWLYAFSRPDDWEFKESDIIKQSTDGRDSVRAALKELENIGYLVRHQEKDLNGRYSKTIFTFHEVPQENSNISNETENPTKPTPPSPSIPEEKKSSDSPSPDFPSTAKPSPANRPLLSIDILNTKGNVSNACDAACGGALPFKKSISKRQQNLDLLQSFELGAGEATLGYLASTYSKEKILDAYNHLKREIEKGTRIRSKIAFFRYTLSGKVSMITQRASTNKKWAENIKNGVSWYSLVIHEKYAECELTKKEVPFDLSQEDFGEAIDRLWQTSKRYGSQDVERE